MLIKYCVFSKILKYFPVSDLTRFPLGVSVYTLDTIAGQTSALHQKHSSEKSQHFKEKTQYLMNTLYERRQIII